VLVARELLGQRLVHVRHGQRLAGLIAETEAYVGEEDLACHARAGPTARNSVMYGPPGHAYVYFTYGMHWCFNCVTERGGFPAAVLLRAILPVEGIEVMRRLRGASRPDGRRIADAHLADGPAKLAQALGIDKQLNGHDLCAREASLFVERARALAPAQVVAGPRVGMGSTPEPWRGNPWNFRILE
jgi:DNA-3-methyladenine glycosylase